MKFRYLPSFKTSDLKQESTEIIVVGSGVSGLRVALELAQDYTVTILTKNEIKASNTNWAQGGIAAVLKENDSYESHITDTLQAGAGLCDGEAVKTLVSRGPDQVKQLIEWGANFDKEGDSLAFGKEGGHSTNRIVHGRGDATGSLVEDVLVNQVRVNPRISIRENSMMVDIIADDQRSYGLTYFDSGTLKMIWSKVVVLACGGLGQIYRETTNHPVVTGDGMAAAFRAGLPLKDVEFVQFHPTTLYVAGGPRFLISEAVRGAGGILKDANGEEFMEGVHPMEELAPRDIVSRAILDRMIETNTECVYLDISHLDSDDIAESFPTIWSTCREYDIRIEEEPIPVRPCAHYSMGGVRTTIQGQTNLSNLFCVGETACTGAHGANRLASNSLLEGLVMGAGLIENVDPPLPEIERITLDCQKDYESKKLDLEDMRRSLKSLMWREVGIQRNSDGLAKAKSQIINWIEILRGKPLQDPSTVELYNMLQLSRIVVECSLWRKESRGAHYRTEYESERDQWTVHSNISYPDFSISEEPVDRLADN